MPFVLFAVGCGLSIAASGYLSWSAATTAELRARAEFLADAQQMRRQLQSGLNSHIEVVRAAGVLLSTDTEINGAEFRRFVNRLELPERYPSIDGMGFAPCVPRRNMNAMLRSLHLDGDTLRVWPASDREERCPIVFLDSSTAQHRTTRGFDLASEELLREAMATARDFAQPAVSRRLTTTVMSGDVARASIFVFIPVYRGALTETTVEGRRRALVGFVFSALGAEHLFDHIVELSAPAVAFDVYDGPSAIASSLLVGSHAPTEHVRYESSERVQVAGRQWLVTVKLLGEATPVPPEEAQRALFGGLVLSFMLFLVTRAQARAWETAARHEAELRASAEALQEREAQATAANRAKDEFLATLSHELRTPLNVVLGWVGLLRHGALGEDRAQRALEIIERNARQQAELIDDLLDVSRIITGKLRLNLRPLEFAPIVSAVVEALRPGADAKGVALQVGPLAEPSTVWGDPDRLRQTVWNLMSNAVKFTPTGGTVSIELTQDDEHVRLKVRDTGVGISPEFLPYVFERFMQADSTTTRTHSGVGLGLAIVRELIELHGGTVQVESAGLGHGAVFEISLPVVNAASQANAPATTTSMTPQLDGVRVLVVDDDPHTLEMLSEALQGSGARVTAANSARHALDRLTESDADVIVSDIAMPGEDGLWLMHRIRTLPGKRGRIPAVALTALARKEDRARAIKAGFQMHMAKPVRLTDLQTVVAALAAEHARGGDNGQAATV